jgi:hypothetical protein
MQSKSDLKLKELKEKQKDLEQRETNLEKKTLVVTTGEEANAKREKELKVWENRLSEKCDEIESRNKKLDHEVTERAKEITVETRVGLLNQYRSVTRQAKEKLKTKEELWIVEHKLYLSLLGIMIVYAFVITFIHGAIWNPQYYEDLNECSENILSILKGAGLAIWQLAELAARLSDNISNETVSSIMNVLLHVIVLVGVGIFTVMVLCRKLLRMLFVHWEKIKIWDKTTLMIAMFLIGIPAILPEMSINTCNISIIIFLTYILLRSFICMENTDVRNTIIKIVAYTVIAIGGCIAFIWYISWSFSQR